MNKRLFALGVALTLLGTTFIQPVFGQEVIQIRSKQVFKLHWAAKYVQAIEGKLYIQPLDGNHPLNEKITLDRLKYLTELALGSDYSLTLKGVTREEVVNQMVLFWSEITGQDPATIMQPTVILYRDEGAINPELLWNIRHANFIGLAKGRDNGNFSPSDTVTYGEAAALLSRLKDIQRQHEKIELNFETTGSYEKMTDKIVFQIQFKNLTNETLPVIFGSGQQFEVTVLDETGEEVYRFSDGRAFTMAIIEKELGPHESFTWQDSWDYQDKAGAKLTKGTYTAVIQVLASSSIEGGISAEELRTELTFTLNQ